MKFIAFITLLGGLLAGSAAQAQEAESISKASAAAGHWLALLDAVGYGESWAQAATIFKHAVTEAEWVKAMQAIRAPLGVVKSRQLKSTQFTKTLPGAPDGDYVVVQFETRFDSKAAALETVVPLLEKDGDWRVSGYFIK
jgi:hypothetical protein